MKTACDNGFGYVEVEPVKVQKKGGLVLPETGGMRAVRIARCLQEPYEGRLIMYRTHMEERAEHQGVLHTFVPVDTVFSLVELDDDEEAVDIIEVDPRAGKESREWISAVH